MHGWSLPSHKNVFVESSEDKKHLCVSPGLGFLDDYAQQKIAKKKNRFQVEALNHLRRIVYVNFQNNTQSLLTDTTKKASAKIISKQHLKL